MEIGSQRPVQTITDTSIPVGIVGDSLDKAATATATRPTPASVGAQLVGKLFSRSNFFWMASRAAR
ncbi:hypothetical protein [Streptomyces sp. NPDC058394]|uniref:hypothetical protein n=1 Tax=Streptomyces sp. NPDC058394 TaxID=3346477 RepID=UPI003656249D